MTNLLLYIQALPCHSLMTLIQHAKVEGNTVYVSDTDYSYAQMVILDTIIHNKFNCPYFHFIEYPNGIRYHWDEEKKYYITI